MTSSLPPHPWPTSTSPVQVGPAICPQSSNHHPTQEPPPPGQERRKIRPGFRGPSVVEPSSQGRPSLTQRKLALLPLLSGASQAFVLLLRPPLAPRTQPAHGTQPHHSWGMKALLTHSPSVLARGGPQEQKQKVKRPRRTDKQTRKGPGGSAKEGAQDPAGKGKIVPPLSMIDTSTSTPKHNAFTLPSQRTW